MKRKEKNRFLKVSQSRKTTRVCTHGDGNDPVKGLTLTVQESEQKKRDLRSKGTSDTGGMIGWS